MISIKSRIRSLIKIMKRIMLKNRANINIRISFKNRIPNMIRIRGAKIVKLGYKI